MVNPHTNIMYIEATKNLTKFASVMKPNEDAFVRMGISRECGIDCLFYMNKGNGREIFSKLIACPTISIWDRGENFIDLHGTFDGYPVTITFSKTNN